MWYIVYLRIQFFINLEFIVRLFFKTYFKRGPNKTWPRLVGTGESPRKRADHRGSVTELTGGQEETVAWPSCETRPDCDYADTASVSEFPDSNYQVT